MSKTVFPDSLIGSSNVTLSYTAILWGMILEPYKDKFSPIVKTFSSENLFVLRQ